MHFNVTSTEAFEGPSIQYIAEDGYPIGHVVAVLIARADGRLFQLPNSFEVFFDDEGFQCTRVRFDLREARRIAAKVEARGYIDLEHWVELSEAELRAYVSAPLYRGDCRGPSYYAEGC